MYAYRENGKWVFPVNMRSRFNGVGAFHTLTDEQRAKHGWYVFDPTNYHYDPKTQNRFGAFNLRVEGIYLKCDYVIQDKTLDTVKDEVRQAVAAYRYDKEVGGIEFGEAIVATDRGSQSMLNAAVSRAKEDSTFTVDWKTRSGFVTLDAPSLIALGNAVSNHVEQCFSAECKVDRDHITPTIDLEALANLDVESLFDGYYND